MDNPVSSLLLPDGTSLPAHTESLYLAALGYCAARNIKVVPSGVDLPGSAVIVREMVDCYPW